MNSGSLRGGVQAAALLREVGVAPTLVRSTMLMPGHRGRQYAVWGTMGQWLSLMLASRKILLGPEATGEGGTSIWRVSSAICGEEELSVGGLQSGGPLSLCLMHPP